MPEGDRRLRLVEIVRAGAGLDRAADEDQQQRRAV